jgi:RNA polymerase sigma-70 factor, ECF subfamily
VVMLSSPDPPRDITVHGVPNPVFASRVTAANPTVTPHDQRGLPRVLTDAELVRHALAGRAHAFDELVDRHYDRCLRYAARLLGNRQDAEEACQDAFLRAYRALDSYAESDRFGAWIYRILINRCRSYAVRRRGTMEDSTDNSVLATLTSRYDPDVEQLGLREELARAIAMLDLEQREAFVLKHVDDLGYDEMSALTGVGVSALKMRVNRACVRLRELLTDAR